VSIHNWGTANAAGQVIKSVDERGITTVIEYGRGGQVLKVTQNQGSIPLLEVYYAYGAHGELTSITPAIGGTGTITFEYGRYLQGTGTNAPARRSTRGRSPG
jgi:hypothetical protein